MNQKFRRSLAAPLGWFGGLAAIAIATTAGAQVAPGPYEFLPFADGFIIEAFKDLNPANGVIADWTGWSGTSWVSPHAYDNHIGSDFSVQSGTPLYAAVSGLVTEVVNGLPPNDHSTYGGNYVRIQANGFSPNGEPLDLLYLHMLQVTVAVNQPVNVGDLVGYSDNTGNSTSEHVHVQTEVRGSGTQTGPFYWGHFKYPIVFNPTGTMQVGRVIRVAATSTPIRADRFVSSPVITTAHRDQLYFCSYPKHGYYLVFIPNQTAYRSGWIRAADAYEVFDGTVIQTLPDKVPFTQLGQLATKFAMRATPNESASQLGQILFGGGRFVADQSTNGFYRIPLPGATPAWGWVKPTARMIVYPQLTRPGIDLATLTNNTFPIQENFSTVGKSMFGRPKFNRSVVETFSPPASGGDGKALLVTDRTNFGYGTTESVTVGKPGHQNYYVQCDVYFNYAPGYLANGAWERYGIFLRDDGFAGLDTTFEGAGNGYAFLWDSDDGRLRAARLTDAAITDFFATPQYRATSGWHRMRVEARGNNLRFYLDGALLVQMNDTAHPAGVCGVGYSWHPGSPATYPGTRGAHFDNFSADTLDTNTTPLINVSSLNFSGGQAQFSFAGAAGNIYEVQTSTELLNWNVLTSILLTGNTATVTDPTSTPATRFYRVRWAQ
ncbi:MAG: M23 family metallopeptidase [Verrucomicrobiae bacterium]|nr:M23 family metallopeptidase [Verrucomicrobiae bacterium]